MAKGGGTSFDQTWKRPVAWLERTRETVRRGGAGHNYAENPIKTVRFYLVVRREVMSKGYPYSLYIRETSLDFSQP